MENYIELTIDLLMGVCSVHITLTVWSNTYELIGLGIF